LRRLGKSASTLRRLQRKSVWVVDWIRDVSVRVFIVRRDVCQSVEGKKHARRQNKTGAPVMVMAEGRGTHVVDLVVAHEGVEEADVGPRQPLPQQVALTAKHRLGVVCRQA